MGLEPRSISTKISICRPQSVGRILNYDQTGRILRVLPFRRPTGVRRVSVLSELKVGESGVLVALDLPETVQNHLMHMGFVPNALVTSIRRAPAGDPTVYSVDGLEIALRRETASAIRVRQPGAVEGGEAAPGTASESKGLIEVAQ
jgi:ferrous iron transport protein A